MPITTVRYFQTRFKDARGTFANGVVRTENSEFPKMEQARAEVDAYYERQNAVCIYATLIASCYYDRIEADLNRKRSR